MWSWYISSESVSGRVCRIYVKNPTSLMSTTWLLVVASQIHYQYSSHSCPKEGRKLNQTIVFSPPLLAVWSLQSPANRKGWVPHRNGRVVRRTMLTQKRKLNDHLKKRVSFQYLRIFKLHGITIKQVDCL